MSLEVGKPLIAGANRLHLRRWGKSMRESASLENDTQQMDFKTARYRVTGSSAVSCLLLMARSGVFIED